MVHICFNYSFYNSLKVAMNHEIIKDNKIVLINKDLSIGKLENLNDIISGENYKKISDHENVIIWYGNNPKELCGLIFTINQFINKNISLVKLDKKTINDYELKYSSSEEVLFEDISYFITNCKQLSGDEKISLSKKWINLVKENSNLRAIINNELQSVCEDFYDKYILKHVSYAWTHIYSVIGEFLSFTELSLKDSFILDRLNYMINLNIIEIKIESNNQYENKIRFNLNSH